PLPGLQRDLRGRCRQRRQRRVPRALRGLHPSRRHRHGIRRRGRGGRRGERGSYDRGRLSAAHMDAATVAFSDIDPVAGALTPKGRTATLGPFEWTAASDVYVFGDDGPFAPGLPHLFVDRFVTQVNNDHNRFRTARATGTINGVPVDAFGPSYLP